MKGVPHIPYSPSLYNYNLDDSVHSGTYPTSTSTYVPNHLATDKNRQQQMIPRIGVVAAAAAASSEKDGVGYYNHWQHNFHNCLTFADTTTKQNKKAGAKKKD